MTHSAAVTADHLHQARAALLILLGVDELMIGVLLPDGPDKTNVQLHYYFRGAAAKSAEAKASRDKNLDMWGQVIRQDFPFVIGKQATLAARDRAGITTRFSPYGEESVYQFQRMVLDAVA